MSEVAIDVVSVGLACPLGLTTLTALTSLRANLRSIYRVDDGGALERRFGEPARASSLIGLGAERSRCERAGFFAHRALFGAFVPFGRTLRGLPTFLALPEARDAHGYTPSQVFASVAASFAGVSMYSSGRAGVFEALRDARLALAEGRERIAMVGAADSMVDAASLARLAEGQRLLGERNPDGLLPGEGAAFLILTRAGASGLPPLARLGPQAEAGEPVPLIADAPSEGAGLTEVLARLRGGASEAVEVVHSAQPPQQYWARELSYAAIRNRALLPDPLVVVRCSDALGELGCAAGAVALVRAILDFHPLIPARALATAPPRRALVYACADAGPVHAGLVSAPPAPAAAQTGAR